MASPDSIPVKAFCGPSCKLRTFVSALFGEVSDSEEEDEKEVNIMDSDEDASTSRLMDTSGGAGAGSGLDQYPTSGFPGADLQMTDSMMSAEGDACKKPD